jgi:hypothetical protein
LARELNVFTRAWLRQVHLLVCARRALERGETLAAAVDAIRTAGPLAEYSAVLDALLGIQRRDPSLDDHEQPGLRRLHAPGFAGVAR